MAIKVSLEEAIWNVCQALDPSIGTYPVSPITNRTTPRAQKRIEISEAVNRLVDEIVQRIHPIEEE